MKELLGYQQEQRRKLKIFLVTLLVLATIVSGVIGIVNFVNRERTAMIDLQKYWYAANFDFDFMIHVRGEWHTSIPSDPPKERDFPFYSRVRISELILPHSSTFNRSYNELVFVGSQEAALALNPTPNMIVAWPMERHDARFTRGLVMNLNTFVQRGAGHSWVTPHLHGRPVINLEDFGLSYPITIEDLAYNWEKVNAVYNALTTVERGAVVNSAWSVIRNADAEAAANEESDEESKDD